MLFLKIISRLFGNKIDQILLAKLFKEVENNFMNLKNEIMDKFSINIQIKIIEYY